MLIGLPPSEIRDLVTYEGNGVFSLDDSAAPEEKAAFEDWYEPIRQMVEDENESL